MIKKILIINLLLLNYLFSNTFIIEDNIKLSGIETSKYQYTYIDKTSKLTIDDIILLKEFTHIKKTNYKATKDKIWTRLSIKNLSSFNKKLFFENDRPLLDIIDIYIFKNNMPYRKIKLGDDRSIQLREMQTRKSTFILDVPKNSEFTIYIMHQGYSSISTFWKIFDRDSYIKTATFEAVAWGFFIGIIVTLILYNTIIYFSIKEISFLIYVFMLIFFTIYQIYINGFYYQFFSSFNIKFLHNINWSTGFLAQAFVILFPIFFFKPKKDGLLYKYLILLFYINICIVVLFLFSIENAQLRYLTKYTDFVTTATIPTLLFVSFWAMYHKLPGARFYFLAQLLYFTLIFYGVFVSIGYFEHVNNIWIFIPLGVIVDVIFLSFALFMKVKKIEQERLENEQLLISQSRFSTMGQTIADLTHQWKTPISQLGSQVFLLKATHNLDRKNFENTFINTLPQIESSIKFLNHTMDDIYNFYANPVSKEKFIIEEEVDSILRMLKNKIENNNIEIIKEIDEVLYYGYKSSLSNSLMSILENAIYQLIHFKENNRKIFITIKDTKDTIIIMIEDNAGGIKNKNFEQLFHIDYSSKKNNGSGIGLALTKRLIENRLKGTIKAANTKTGAVFKIVFPKY